MADVQITEIWLAVEYFALTPAAPIVEWLQSRHAASFQLRFVCAVHTACCVLFWSSFAHNQWWQQIQMVTSGTALATFHVINVGRAWSARSWLFAGPRGEIYLACLQTLSVVNFVFAGPLFGKSRADARYGKWIIIAGALSASSAIAVVAIVASDYYDAWGCYHALGFPAALKYQNNSVCIHPHARGHLPPACKPVSATTLCADGNAPYDGEMLRPFRWVLSWAILQLAVVYAFFDAMVFRSASGGTLAYLLTKKS